MDGVFRSDGVILIKDGVILTMDGVILTMDGAIPIMATTLLITTQIVMSVIMDILLSMHPEGITGRGIRLTGPMEVPRSPTTA